MRFKDKWSIDINLRSNKNFAEYAASSGLGSCPLSWRELQVSKRYIFWYDAFELERADNKEFALNSTVTPVGPQQSALAVRGIFIKVSNYRSLEKDIFLDVKSLFSLVHLRAERTQTYWSD